MLVLSQVLTANIASKKLLINDKRDDFDPLVDIAVSVDIQKIRSLEKEDRQLRVSEVIDTTTDPDFYLKVFINQEEFISPVWDNIKYIYDPQWCATLDVPDDVEFVSVRIQLWDAQDETSDSDRLCDISGDYDITEDSFDVELDYSIKTGHWSGDDYLDHDPETADPSGYGRLNGCDDGTIYQQDRDCEVWFAISQNDYDDDGIPYWTEVNVFETDPMINNTGEDVDNDDIPIEWEWKWGYDPLSSDNHDSLDPEDDGLNNYEEYLTSQWYSDPFRDDLFIELDQMQQSPQGQDNLLPDGSKEILTTAYDRYNLVYHLDDGSMGGGEMIPFDEDSDYNDLYNIYMTYFLHGDVHHWRRGIFHYGVVIYSTEIAAGAAFGPNRFFIQSTYHEQKASSPFIGWLLDRDTIYASAVMHETGHTFGYNPIGGHNRWSLYPWQFGWWYWRPYKSCMNYGYMYTTVDYSDGSRGNRDYNDWTRMDLSYFEQEWH